MWDIALLRRFVGAAGDGQQVHDEPERQHRDQVCEMKALPLKVAASVVALAGVLLGPVVVVAQRSEDQALQAELAAKGLAIVKDKCASCHATGMDDASPHEKAPPFRDIVTRYPSENLAEALAEGIVSGHPDMPVFVFEPDEIEGFIAYLDSLGPETQK